MISFLKGKILNKTSKNIILLVGDIGYKIFIPQTLLEKIKPEETLELYTYLRHKEDEMSLYGFKTKDELDFFELLITISGVGPKSALGILEVAKLTDVKKAIIRDDAAILYKVSGIGKKTAERIVVELKNKLASLPTTEEEISFSDSDTEIFDALQGLGYKDRDIRDALKQLPPDLESTNDKIKNALKYLSK